MEKDRIHFLDGLRGWGALSVLLCHAFVDVFPVDQASMNLLSQTFLFNGTFAVWVFFIVSGFSLSVHFCETREGSSLKRMFVGRYFRLAVPILIVSLLVWAASNLGLIPDVEKRQGRLQEFLVAAPSIGDTITFSSYGVFFDYKPSQTLVPPLWTMTYEIWGSFLILALLALIGELGKRWALYAILCYLTYHIHPIYTAFLVGLLLAEIHASRLLMKHESMVNRLSTIVFPGILLLATFLPGKDTNNYPGLFLTVSSLFVTCVLLNKSLTAFFSNTVSRWLGTISFPLYLIQAPVFFIVSLNLYNHVERSLPVATAINLATILIALALARGLVFADALGIKTARFIGRHFVASPLRAKAQAVPGNMPVPAIAIPSLMPCAETVRTARRESASE